MFEQLLAPRYWWWLWDGFLVTLAISVLTIILSTILGFLLVIAQQSQIKIIKAVIIGYNAIFRYSPLLPQLFFCILVSAIYYRWNLKYGYLMNHKSNCFFSR